MTIKELKEFIKDLPDDMEVYTKDSEWGTGDSYLEIDKFRRWNLDGSRREDKDVLIVS